MVVADLLSRAHLLVENHKKMAEYARGTGEKRRHVPDWALKPPIPL